MTPLELFYPRTEGLPWSRSILGLKDCRGAVLLEDRMTPLESFVSEDRMTLLETMCPGMERLPFSRSIPGQNDSPGVIPSQDKITPLKSFHHWTDGLPWSRSIQGLTHLESFHPMTEGVSWSRSIPGQNDSPGVVPSLDRMISQEYFHPRTK